MSATAWRWIGTIALLIFAGIGFASCRSLENNWDRQAEYQRLQNSPFLTPAQRLVRSQSPSGFALFVAFIRWAAIGIVIKLITAKIASSKEPSDFVYTGSGSHYGSKVFGEISKEERAAEMIAQSMRGDPDSRASRELRKMAAELLDEK